MLNDGGVYNKLQFDLYCQEIIQYFVNHQYLLKRDFITFWETNLLLAFKPMNSTWQSFVLTYWTANKLIRIKRKTLIHVLRMFWCTSLRSETYVTLCPFLVMFSLITYGFVSWYKCILKQGSFGKMFGNDNVIVRIVQGAMYMYLQHG